MLLSAPSPPERSRNRSAACAPSTLLLPPLPAPRLPTHHRPRPQDGRTGLWMASQNGHLKVVRQLLDSRADPSRACEVDPSQSILFARPPAHARNGGVYGPWSSAAGACGTRDGVAALAGAWRKEHYVIFWYQNHQRHNL